MSCSGRIAAATARWAGGQTVNAGRIPSALSDSEFDADVESEEQIFSISCFGNAVGQKPSCGNVFTAFDIFDVKSAGRPTF